MPLIQQSGKTADAAAQWLRWADQDYLGARSLLLRGLLVQGSGLSNTAVEKYLKTVLTLKQVTFPRGWRGHDVVFLYEQLAAAGVDLHLNKAYLKILVKAYTTRYPDDLEVGFNIVLEQVKMLAELDATVHRIRKGFELKEGDRTRQTTIDGLLERKDLELLDRNCAFGTYSRADLFAGPSHIYELRILPNETPLEAMYLAQDIKDDGRFDLEALKPGRT
jgi:HEPN domain-containing protein